MEYILGTRASYSCDDRAELFGVSTRVCVGDDLWSGNAPSCQSMFNSLPLICCIPVVLWFACVIIC